MKIIFIYLPHPYLKQPDSQVPIGILYLAAILEKRNIDVNIKNYSSYSIDGAIKDLPEADLYGITITSMELPQANRFAEKIKEKYSNCKIVLGGPGTFTDEFVDWTFVDSICKGEGEITILDILKDAKQNCLKRVYQGKCMENLDNLPFPARHLLKKQGGHIFAYNKNYMGTESTIILSSRGCPYLCAFCSASYFTPNRKVRFRSGKEIAKEMRFMIDNYNIRQFRFSDDMFTASKEHVFEVCKNVGKLNVAWRISVRTKPFDYEVAKVLKDAGCKEVSFGVESFDNNVLKVLRKGTTNKDNARALEICDKVGIKARILFMIRTPGQTKETVPINIKWLKRVPYNIIACTSLVPLPGSDIWANPNAYNIEILNYNLDDYNFYFFGSKGEIELKSIFKIKDRSLREFNKESIYFKDYLKSTGKLNRG